MIFALVLLSSFITFGEAVNFDYEEEPQRSYLISHRSEEDDSEPASPLPKDAVKVFDAKNIHCEDFSSYSTGCSIQAALLYNSSRKVPPLPEQMDAWCRAIKNLTSCAIDWNTDCGDVSDNRFDDESIKGHKHVLENICDDEWFQHQYAELSACIKSSADAWESCYIKFKVDADSYKNSTKEQTHFKTHFYLCCARARFRRCTLDALFTTNNTCVHEEVITLQKFSTIVSEGDVFQNCEFNMMYQNCPGGDPRPSKDLLVKLVDPEYSRVTQQKVAMALVLLTLILTLCRCQD